MLAMDSKVRRLLRLGALWAGLGLVALSGCKDQELGDGLHRMRCNTCHGNQQNAAPPSAVMDLSNPNDHRVKTTADIEVGAHQLHLHDGIVRKAIACSECHVVPKVPEQPGHLNGTHARLTFGPLATADGKLEPTWDRESATCSNVYCHGATLHGGKRTTPRWTYAIEPDYLKKESLDTCDGCHGAPPPAPHIQGVGLDRCYLCHPQTVNQDGSIDIEGGKHMDGKVEVLTEGRCNLCHGNAENNAPPQDTHGNQDTSLVTVGAHQAHVLDSTWHKTVACSECHVVPSSVEDPTHIDNATATVTFGSLATHGGRTPTWDPNSATCSNTYCHSQGGDNQSPVWTKVDGSQEKCTSCHHLPPDDHLTSGRTGGCNGCHPDIDSDMRIIPAQKDLHINGVIDVKGCDSNGCACGTCHQLPPQDGAHAVHHGSTDPKYAAYGDTRVLEDYDPTGATQVYLFGCGNCHPLDPAKHMDGTVEVELYNPSAPAGSIKSMNPPSAAYDPATQTCSNVYCHSSGNSSGAIYRDPPAWNSGQHLGCNGCHDDPPRYPSGPPGSATANSHLGWSVNQGTEEGHFWADPTAMNNPNDPDAHPGPIITCQTCHAATVDPTNTAQPNLDRDPSKPLATGFYYLDIGGDFTMPQRANGAAYPPYVCADCHTGKPGEPAAGSGTGKVLPLRHVNGKRDVVFDDRQTLPFSYSFGTDGSPTRPEFMWTPGTGPIGCNTAYDSCNVLESRWSLGPDLVSFFLSNTFTDSTHPTATPTYDPVNKTCSNVGCHWEQAMPQWGAYGDWNLDPDGCNECHHM